MSEFAPIWSNPKMTKAQVRKYIKNMKEAQKIAKEKLKEAEKNWELEDEIDDLKKLEEMIDKI